jgi:hypothetical protein
LKKKLAKTSMAEISGNDLQLNEKENALIDEILFDQNPHKVERLFKEYIKEIPSEHVLKTLDKLESIFEDYATDSSFPHFTSKKGSKVLDEINRVIEMLRNTSQQLPTSSRQPYFKLSSRISKIDLIRLLNAMYAMRFCEKTDGSIPSKKEFMNAMGEIFSIDLSKYDSDLSQSFKSSLENNLEIFSKLSEKIEHEWSQRNQS